MLDIDLFANFRISNEERLQRLLFSYESIKNIHFNTARILIRGELASKTAVLLKAAGCEFEIILVEDDDLGWLHQTFVYTRDLPSVALFLWIEDHAAIKCTNSLKALFEDFISSDADVMPYTFHIDKHILPYESLTIPVNYKSLRIFPVKRNSSSKSRELYISPLPSIFKRNFFDYILLNAFSSFYRWPHYTPFNFEKLSKDVHKPVVLLAYPLDEVFVSIDDDLEYGYSLISRGIYQSSFSRDDHRLLEGNTSSIRVFIKNSFLYKYILPLHIFRKVVVNTIRFTFVKMRKYFA